eukprot:710579-Prymnesium_polylepis.4
MLTLRSACGLVRCDRKVSLFFEPRKESRVGDATAHDKYVSFEAMWKTCPPYTTRENGSTHQRASEAANSTLCVARAGCK